MGSMLLIFAICCSVVQFARSLDCDDEYECASSTITLSSDSENLNCDGYFSCANTTSNIGGTINCLGSNSCFRSSTMISNGSNGIDCEGLYSCAQISALKAANSDIECMAEKSCFGSNIHTSTLQCRGDQSCAESSMINTTGTTYFRGFLAGKNSTFYRCVPFCNCGLCL